MENQKLTIFSKGKFQNIDKSFMLEGMSVLQKVTQVQKKYNKPDTDTFINELRDSITGYYLGFKLVNVEKHGFDCQYSKAEKIFLEVKSASVSAKAWQATFNDTTYEKANAFKDKKLWLALSVWENASELLFTVFGQNIEIGNFLETKVKHFKDGYTVRSTQSISVSDLLLKYNFNVLCINRTKEEVKSMLVLQNKKLQNIHDEQLKDLSEFKKLY